MKRWSTVLSGRVLAGGALLLVLAFFGIAFGLYYFRDVRKITAADIAASEKLSALEFTGSERTMMRRGLTEARDQYRQLRTIPLPNAVAPAFRFSPLLPGMELEKESRPFVYSEPEDTEVPENFEDLAFYSVTQLARLIKARKITSTDLTELYLRRLKAYGPKLECVVTLTEDLAREQARRADEEIAGGTYRGPLHGIPWGAKDLLAVKGYPTTWGSAVYKEQVFEEDATVVRKLEEAGAVLVAKLSMGELAMGDRWFGGRTKNPWDLAQGSSGSSAGSAAATAAGLVAFGIGTETLGSIVSPSTRCGVTGLRPTFGRVSRSGAMALSWTMDKIGPICRTVEDCALVFEAIRGADGADPSAIDAPFNWDPGADLASIRVGYLKKAFEADSRTKKFDGAALEVLRGLGIEPAVFEMPALSADALSFILDAEAAAAFDDVTRTRRDRLMTGRRPGDWPNIFRQARFVPAVEYIQANRARVLLMEDMARKMEGIDVFITPSYGENVLLVTNLTGHPAVVVPDGFDDRGRPVSISFIGSLYGEAAALRIAKAYQDATDFHLRHPKLED